jgi:hypothetical protein
VATGQYNGKLEDIDISRGKGTQLGVMSRGTAAFFK